MEHVILASATLMLAIGFPHWEPPGRIGSATVQSRLLGLTGVVSHLGGTALIGWLSGFAAGAVAFFAIPTGAAVAYTLIVRPLMRSYRTKRRSAAPPINAQHAIRQL